MVTPRPVAPTGPVQRGIAPTPSTMGSVDPFLASLARDRDAQLGRIRGNFQGFTSELQGALAALIPGFGQIYDRAEASAAATNKAVADRLGVSGEQAQADLGAKTAQINAPGTAPQDLGQLYKGAAGAGFAYGAADVERLNEEGAAAELFASKMPFITGLEGARVAGQLMSGVEEDYRTQNTNYLKEKMQQDREDKRYREEVEREERQRLEDRQFEQAQARAAQRQREKEFMLTLMADATEAQRKAAEKRLEREWDKEDAQIKRQHDIEMANLRADNSYTNAAAGRAESRAQADKAREDQQAFQAGENAKARAAAKAKQNDPNKPVSVAQWMVEDARRSVLRTTNKNQRKFSEDILPMLRSSPGQSDGIINGAINASLRASGINPNSQQGKNIRRRILKAAHGTKWIDSKGNERTYYYVQKKGK